MLESRFGGGEDQFSITDMNRNNGVMGIGAIDDNLGVMFVPVNLRPQFTMLQ
jgi:hypothetical protein